MDQQMMQISGKYCPKAIHDFFNDEAISCRCCPPSEIAKCLTLEDGSFAKPRATTADVNHELCLEPICGLALYNFVNGKNITCQCYAEEMIACLTKYVGPSKSPIKNTTPVNRSLRANNTKSLKCKSPKSLININNKMITRYLSSYLQEHNTTRHRYELSGGSPLKWIKDKNEFDRPLTKVGSFRYEIEV